MACEAANLWNFLLCLLHTLGTDSLGWIAFFVLLSAVFFGIYKGSVHILKLIHLLDSVATGLSSVQRAIGNLQDAHSANLESLTSRMQRMEETVRRCGGNEQA